MSHQKICAVIPAAGKGTRLGVNVPKVFVPVTAEKTIWNILHEKLLPYVDHIQLVLSEAGLETIKQNLSAIMTVNTTAILQPEPIGMGDAVFRGSEFWDQFDHILVIWGDQVFISKETIERTIQIHLNCQSHCITFPIIKTPRPYVDYLFNSDGKLETVLQSREGDICREMGQSDVGLFCLSIGEQRTELMRAWTQYLDSKKDFGAHTKEINFLPFLAFLSTQMNWQTNTFEVFDAREARGINNQDDLIYFQKLFAR